MMLMASQFGNYTKEPSNKNYVRSHRASKISKVFMTETGKGSERNCKIGHK